MNIKNGNTYVIRTPGINKYTPSLPKYKMIINKSKEGLLTIRELPETSIQIEINEQKNNIVELLQVYSKIDANDNRVDEKNDMDGDGELNEKEIKSVKLGGKFKLH
jgi:hypothetical protein